MQASKRLTFCVAHLNYCRRFALRCQGLLMQSTSFNRKEQNAPVRSLSSDAIPPPSAEGAPKQYSPKIEQLVSDISQLTLLEVSDLNELLKEEEEEAEPKREKTSFTVKLMQFDAGKKVQLIKEIKSVVEGLNLVQAKKFVESVPQIVRSDISKEEAEKLKETLSAVGAQIEID